MKRCAWVLVLCLTCASMGLAAEKPKAPPEKGISYYDGVNLILTHMPKLIRGGAELYCIRLEMIGHLYKKDHRDRDVNKTIKALGKTVRNLGMAGLNGVVALRERLPYGKMMRAVTGWRNRGKKGNRANRRKRVVAQRIGKRIGRGIRRRLGKIGMLKAQITEGIKALHLSEDQRRDLKLQVVTSLPSIIRGGASLLGDGMELGRELIQKELPVKSCAERILRISEGIEEMARSAVDLAFMMKKKLTKEQQKRFLANLPLRLILFR